MITRVDMENWSCVYSENGSCMYFMKNGDTLTHEQDAEYGEIHCAINGKPVSPSVYRTALGRDERRAVSSFRGIPVYVKTIHLE